jgi:glutamate synthase (NADPH/NADH) small chain
MPEKFKVKMRELDPLERVNNFEEVALGYTKRRQLQRQTDVSSASTNPVLAAAPLE